MGVGTPISQYEKATSIPENSTYIADMGDGSGTKGVTQKKLAEEVGKALKIGNIEALQTEDKTSLVGAINEAAQSGGGGSAVDILDTKEEIEANTEPGKAAGAQAVKEMFGALNDNINGNILTYNESEDAYYIQHGADSVPKKLGSTLKIVRAPGNDMNANAARTLNVADFYPDYKNLTLDNFMLTDVRLYTYQSSQALATQQKILQSYDAESGVLNLGLSATIGKYNGFDYVYTVSYHVCIIA